VPNELFANADQLTVAETLETRTMQGTKTHQKKLGTTINNSGLEFGRAIFSPHGGQLNHFFF